MTAPVVRADGGHLDPRDEVRARALEAERARPDTKPQTAGELLDLLIGQLHHLFRTPADEHQRAASTRPVNR